MEQWTWSKAYLRGLLGDALRKNVEQMALDLGEKVRSLQYFIGQSPWEAEPVIGMHQRLVGESLGEADGVVLIDESGVVKQGDESVGVAAAILWLGGEDCQQSGWGLPGLCQPQGIQPDRRAVVYARRVV